MKKIGIIVFAAALVLGLSVASIFSFGKSSGRLFDFSFNIKGVRGSGKIASDTRNVSAFKGVNVGGKFQVEITAQQDFGVVVEADENLLQYIRTDVKNGVLHIETDRKIAPSELVHIRVSAPEINALDVSGVASVTVNGIKTDEFSLDSSGAAKINLSGEAGKITADASGATKIDAEKLVAGDAVIDASGASQISINVTGELRADASGASKIFYTGTPTNIEKSTSGASRVSPK